MPSKITTNVLVQAMKKAGLDPTNPAHMEAFAEAYADAFNQAISLAVSKTKQPATEAQPAGSRPGQQLLDEAYGARQQALAGQQSTQQNGKAKTGAQLLQDYYTQGEK